MSEARSAGVQPKREATLSTVTGLTTRTMHAVYRITILLYPIFVYRRMILLCFFFFCFFVVVFLIHILSHHKIQVPIGLVAEEI